MSFKGAAIVMGVASCGKTTLGEALAKELGLAFVEGDKLHPPENIAKMSSGQPLTDDDRWPWLVSVGAALRGEGGIIAACSSLKKIYRLKLAEAARRPVHFVHLRGAPEVLAQRIAQRKGHFMPASLLQSQLATLEMPSPPESFIQIDVAEIPPEQLARAIDFLQSRK